MQADATHPERLRVMVVDDDRDGATTLAALLELEGYEVRTEHDGLSVLPAVDEWHPSCVLLDIDLPGLDGFAIARGLRSQASQHGTVLIATTGWSRPVDRETAAVCGIDHFLAKPVELDELLALMPHR